MFIIVFRLWEGELRDRRGVMGARIQHKFDILYWLTQKQLKSEKIDNTISNIKATYAQRLMDIVFYVYVYIRSELVGFNLFAAYLCRTSINYNEPRAFSNLLIVLSVLSTLSTKSSLICTVVCHNHANLLVFFKVKTIDHHCTWIWENHWKTIDFNGWSLQKHSMVMVQGW